MLELIQIAWDIFMLRDSARKGQLKLRGVIFAIVFVVLLYGTGVPAAALYQNHPQYRLLFLATMVFDVALFVSFMTWGIRYNLQLRRDPLGAAGNPPQG